MSDQPTRRDIARLAGIAALLAMPRRRARAVVPQVARSSSNKQEPAPTGATAASHYAVAVIGSGFGGTMTALSLARVLKERPGSRRMLILERGAWWTTPVETVQDKQVATADFLREKKQPVRYWASAEHFKGLVDLLLRCVRRPHHEDGLYDVTSFGKGADGLTVVRSNGVGGGSLIYANVTIKPPDFIFKDPRWPLGWSDAERDHYFHLARHAIGYGVLSARDAEKNKQIPYLGLSMPPGAMNTGLSNIVTRSTRLDPHWNPTPTEPGGKQIAPGIPADPTNADWIDRARVFQTAMAKITSSFGTVDSSINDLTPEGTPLGPTEPPANYPNPKPKNYCERQGRCILGCLPGARHTLNKQLMTAVLGTFNPADPKKPVDPLFDFIDLTALAEVDLVRELPAGGYEIQFRQRDEHKPAKTTPRKVTADQVILAAGCVGTTELLLRSRAQGKLSQLSDRLGHGFSTNGDYLAFLEKTNERINLTRGPVTTSFGHFNTRETEDRTKFHTIEDNGIPKALSVLVGQGVPAVRSMAKHGSPGNLILTVLLRLLGQFFKDVWTFLSGRIPPALFEAEDLLTTKMMCIAGMGREASVGKFRLEDGQLRVARTDGKQFYDDEIYKDLKASLSRFASHLATNQEFRAPLEEGEPKAVASTHPLGGCTIGKDWSTGVVDEFGRVFQRPEPGRPPFYKGLYVADASIIPTALGVNPSLTISALALRIADKIISELPTGA